MRPEPGDRVVVTDGIFSGRTGTVISVWGDSERAVVQIDGPKKITPAIDLDRLEPLGEEHEDDIEFETFGLTADELATYVAAFSTLTANKIAEGQGFYDHGGYQEAEVVRIEDLLSATLDEIEAAGTTLAILHLRVTRILGALKGTV